MDRGTHLSAFRFGKILGREGYPPSPHLLKVLTGAGSAKLFYKILSPKGLEVKILKPKDLQELFRVHPRRRRDVECQNPIPEARSDVTRSEGRAVDFGGSDKAFRGDKRGLLRSGVAWVLRPAKDAELKMTKVG